MKTKHLCSLVLLALSAFFMASCDTETPQTPDVPVIPPDTTATPYVKKPVAAVFNCSFSITDSMAIVADFNIEYYDENGKIQTEQLKDKTWKKSVAATLPAKLGLRVTAKVKE